MEISCALSEGGLYCVPKYMALVHPSKEHLQPWNAEGYPSSKAVAFQCSAPEWVGIWRPDPCPTCLLPISNAGPMASSSFVISSPPGPQGSNGKLPSVIFYVSKRTRSRSGQDTEQTVHRLLHCKEERVSAGSGGGSPCVASRSVANCRQARP